MRFVDDKKEAELINDVQKEIDRQDQLGIAETKQAEEPKPVVNSTKKDMVTMTLVNMRKNPSKTAEVVETVKGGETVSAEARDYGEFKKVTYNRKEGYINKKYLR